MARKTKEPAARPVDPDQVARALTKAVVDGDIVNFRLIFAPWSPARESSSQDFGDERFSYLLPAPDEEESAEYKETYRVVRDVMTWAHIQEELGADRPAQLSSELLVPLGDHAVRLGKYSSAAQAYELLRMRRRMQVLFYDKAVEALQDGRMEQAVQGFRIGIHLAYDYAAFPEPLPATPNYPSKALLLHGSYPMRPEDCVALLPEEQHVQTALEYLLSESDAAARLREVPLERRLEFVEAYVRIIDPEWDRFAERYRETCSMIVRFQERMRRGAPNAHAKTLEDEVEWEMGEDPHRVMATLMGRDIPDGEWWRYLRELTYLHPGAALFVGRQMIGETEIIMPRLRSDSRLAKRLLGDIDQGEVANVGSRESTDSDDDDDRDTGGDAAANVVRPSGTGGAAEKAIPESGDAGDENRG